MPPGVQVKCKKKIFRSLSSHSHVEVTVHNSCRSTYCCEKCDMRNILHLFVPHITVQVIMTSHGGSIFHMTSHKMTLVSWPDMRYLQSVFKWTVKVRFYRWRLVTKSVIQTPTLYDRHVKWAALNESLILSSVWNVKYRKYRFHLPERVARKNCL